jgi:outer membrane protein OmpA-like peptidoglycan-associated protein
MQSAKTAAEVRTMKEDLKKLEQDPELAGKLEVEQINEREVLVRLTSAGFFNPGGSEPNDKAFKTLEALARRVRSYKAVETRVEGHTDNIPIAGGKYPSNWELSAARSSAVVRALVSRAGMDPTRMSAIGYGEFRPIADNSTLEGRKANRRIDIMIRQPAPAEEKKWHGSNGGGRPKPASIDDEEAWDENLLLGKRKERATGKAETPPQDGAFLESFGLHSGLNETGKPPPAASPPTRRAPLVNPNSAISVKDGKAAASGGGH